MRLIAASAGSYFHIETLEGPRYAGQFNRIIAPERLAEELTPQDILLIPCRTPPRRMMGQQELLRGHLENGGTVVAMGESRSDQWLPAIRFEETPTNWWWWLTPGADLGVTITAPGHPLLTGLSKADVSWHLHGWFTPPAGAETLITDPKGRAILYIDEASTPGRMIITSLDPMYHHGSHFMPATTRFLDRFLPNLRTYAARKM